MGVDKDLFGFSTNLDQLSSKFSGGTDFYKGFGVSRYLTDFPIKGLGSVAKTREVCLSQKAETLRHTE